MEVGKGEHDLIAHCIMEHLVEIILGIHILGSIAAADSVDQTGRSLVDMTAALSEGRDEIAKVRQSLHPQTSTKCHSSLPTFTPPATLRKRRPTLEHKGGEQSSNKN